MENTFSINRKQILSLTAAVIFLALAIIVPGGGALTKPMVSSIFLVLFALTLWIFEPIPLAISSFLVLLIAYLFGLTSSLNESFSGIAIAANWFYIPSMGIGMALLKTSFAQKMLANLLKISGTGAKKITLCFMLITYVLSAVMSDIAAVVLAVGFATEFVNQIKEDDVRKNFKRMVMVSLPIASLIGGTATPAGSTVNVMALSLLKTYNGVEITFVQWMGIGVPVSFIALLLAWFVVTLLFKAPDLNKEMLDEYIKDFKNYKSELHNEKLVFAIVALIIVAWIAGSWIKVLNVNTVAFIGLGILFLPWTKVFTWKEFSSRLNWEIPIMQGATISLGSVLIGSGLVTLATESIFTSLSNLSLFALIAIMSLVVTALLTIIPNGPAIISMLAVPVYILAERLGVNPLVVVIAVAMFSSNGTILPLNPVSLVPYSKGYFTIGDSVKSGIAASLLWIVVAALWISLSGSWIF